MARTVIVGLDGVPFGLVRDFARKGVMPHTAGIISEGVFKPLSSSTPEVSSVAWASVITGANPGVHGIYGFTELTPETYKMRFPNYNDLKAPAFWEQWPGRSIVINVPGTYPARKMNGVLISGFVSPDFQRSVYPKSLIPSLSALGYRLDVDVRQAHHSMDAFLQDLDCTLDARVKACRHLRDNLDWQTFMIVFTGTDRLMHSLWDAYEDETHKYHDRFADHFARIDRAIGEISENLADEDRLILHSDHGFERLEKDVYVNHVLMENGFLRLDADRRAGLEGISDDTTAFALDPARIYLHRRGRYPRGTVDEIEGERLLSEMSELFLALEVDGRKVIRAVYRKEDAYSGPCVSQAPDLVLQAAEGFSLRGKAQADVLAQTSPFTGKHTRDTGFLLVRNPVDQNVIPEQPTVCDILAVAGTSTRLTAGPISRRNPVREADRISPGPDPFARVAPAPSRRHA